MNRKTVRLIALIIVIALAAGMLSALAMQFVSATNTAQMQEQEQKKKDAQENLDAAKEKKAKTLEVMEGIEKEVGDVQMQIDSLNAKIAETDRELTNQNTLLAEAEENARKQEELFKERFRVMCEMGDVSYIEMLLSANSFNDLVDRAEVVKEITTHDKEVFDKMERTRQDIQNARDRIVTLKQSQEDAKKELDGQKAALVAKQQEQKAYMAELESDAAAYQKIIDEADAAMESLRRQAAASLSTEGSGAEYVGGEFGWPTPGYGYGYITSHFSPRRKNPVSGIYKRHTGTDIGAPYGASIVAANSGTVTLAGWNSGYGNCVIIDHGGGRATLYAHMSAYSVSAGQYVERGQQIGKVGSTGNSTGPHLHFEVLINGAAVDAMQFF